MPNVTPATAGEAATSTAPRTIVARIIARPSLVTCGRVKMAGSGTRCQRQATAALAASGRLRSLCPGNHESAGKRLSGRTRFANRTLRMALVESARGAIRTRNCYLAAQYRRLVRRRGDKKPVVADA